jgi:hypothetical protein
VIHHVLLAVATPHDSKEHMVATGRAGTAVRIGGSIVFAVALVVGLWSSAALAAGNPASPPAPSEDVVLLPEDDGPYELVRDDPNDGEWDEDWDDDWDEDWDEDEADRAIDEDVDEAQVVIGDGVEHSRLVRSQGRVSLTAGAPTGSQPRAVPVPAAGTSPEVALPADPPSTSAPLAASVLGTHLERSTNLTVPPVELFAAPAGHTTGSSSRSATDEGPAGSTLVAALLALTVLAAGGALLHRPRP